ncbi:MAG: hypothetical protein EBU34_11930 [Alphaproteobacteria bacterium]|nr:hypothetical protein [Alphaproteobacteria bacterium]
MCLGSLSLNCNEASLEFECVKLLTIYDSVKIFRIFYKYDKRMTYAETLGLLKNNSLPSLVQEALELMLRNGIFAPGDAFEDGLLVYLREKFSGHVSMERILSGAGIAELYGYMRSTGILPESEALAAALQTAEDPAREISFHALEYHDPLARETLRRFARIYGAEAGNLALKCLSRGGVLIGGGIAPKILNALVEDGQFMAGFLAKGRFSHFLKELPVRVALNPNTALLGAADYAARCMI